MYIPDISHWVPVKHWDLVKLNCSFMITKATQGTAFIDPFLGVFIDHCEDYHIPYWLYVFLNPGGERTQAEFMVRVCKPMIGPYFQGYILDVESGNPAAGCAEALKYIKTQSAKTMFYTYYGQYHIYSKVIAERGENCAFWEARYGANNGAYSMPCHANADMHQFTSSGVCPGIGNIVDLNRLTGSLPLEWFTGSKPVAEEEEEMQGLIIDNSKIYYYNIASKLMFHVANPDALKLLKEEYKRENGKDLKYMDSKKFETLKILINGKAV